MAIAVGTSRNYTVEDTPDTTNFGYAKINHDFVHILPAKAYSFV
jgi:hypothetical protein